MRGTIIEPPTLCSRYHCPPSYPAQLFAGLLTTNLSVWETGKGNFNVVEMQRNRNGIGQFRLIFMVLPYWTRPTGVHLNIRAGPTFAVLLWTVPPIYNYKSGRGVWGWTIKELITIGLNPNAFATWCRQP